jgi:hypothetical protein
MPSTFIHAGFALLLGAALLQDEYDRRAVLMLLVLVILPDLDSFAGALIAGAHRSLLHTLLIPLIAAIALSYDTRVRDQSWLRTRFGSRGLQLAWTGVFVHIFAAVLLDYTHLDGVGLLFPVNESFYQLEGELGVAPDTGLVQTFVEIQTDPDTGKTSTDIGKTGTREETHVPTPVQPNENVSVIPNPDTEQEVDRRFPFAVGGWQLYFVFLGLFTMAAKRLQRPIPEGDADDKSDTASGESASDLEDANAASGPVGKTTGTTEQSEERPAQEEGPTPADQRREE